MPTIGTDCHLILDGQGYLIEPNSYTLARPRVRRAEHTRTAASGSTGAGERYLDMGPGKREWSFVVVAFQAMRDFTGNLVSATGQQYRDALHTSYQKVATVLAFTDPQGAAWSVHFDELTETIADVRAAGDGELQ